MISPFSHRSKPLLQRLTRKSKSIREKTRECSAGKLGTNYWKTESATETTSPQVQTIIKYCNYNRKERCGKIISSSPLKSDGIILINKNERKICWCKGFWTFFVNYLIMKYFFKEWFYFFLSFCNLSELFRLTQWAPSAASCAPNSAELVRMRRRMKKSWRGRWRKTSHGRNTASMAFWEIDVSSSFMISMRCVLMLLSRRMLIKKKKLRNEFE